MGRSTPKTNNSVIVPKDGPVFCFFGSKVAGDGAQQNVVGMHESLALLSSTEAGESDDASPSQVLWRILVTSDQIRAQLQGLQAYKSKVIQLNKNKGATMQEHELIGTYRLLLEWCLCNDIPTPFRRAILSNLNTLDSIIGEEAFRIRKQVVASLFEEQECWSNPLGTLFEMLNYEPLRSIIVEENGFSVQCLELLVHEADALQPFLTEQSFYNQADNERPQSVSSRTTVAAVEKCTFLAATLKLFLTQVLSSESEEAIRLAPLVESMQHFLFCSLACRGVPSDDLNVIGVANGQALVFHWKCSNDSGLSSFLAGCAVERVKSISADTLLPELNKLAVVQGITATLPNEALVEHSPPIFSDLLAPYLLEQCQTAIGASVRLSGLRALHTLINRCVAIMSTDLLEESEMSYMKKLCYSTLEVVLQSWESPPVRQVATAIPGLFRSLIVLLRKSDSLNETASSSLEVLVKRILDLPPNRKGKYIALESLLPEVGASFLIEVAGDDLITYLIKGIGEGGHNIVALSDLLVDLLSRLRVEMNEQAGLVTTSVGLSRKERRKLERTVAQDDNVNGKSSEQELPFVPDWVALWCPNLARGLMFGSRSSRKHISTRCIPALVDVVGGSARRQDATFVFSFLLEEVRIQQSQFSDASDKVGSYSCETETLSDRALWASFEIAKQASMQKLLRPPYSSPRLTAAISNSIPDNVLKSSLTHSSESIRLVAFASIEAIVPMYFSSDVPPLQLLEKEVACWRNCLHYSSKSGSKAFVKDLFLILSSLLNRLSDVESACHVDESNTSLPVLTSFVCDFLISEMLLQQTAYPGTVEEKEGFALSLFQCILWFATQGMAGSQAGKSQKSNQVQCCRKSFRTIEAMTMRHILSFLLAEEPMSALFSLLHSTWDNTRGMAYTCLCDLIEHAHTCSLQFPNRFYIPESITARGIHLAASPRQREADTGARTLALVGAMYKTDEGRGKHKEAIFSLLDERLGIMADMLLGDGSKMPMAHGLLMTFRITIENRSIPLPKNDLFFERFVLACCRALQLSLSVVADLKDGATLADNEEIEQPVRTKTSNTPLNVNTGAIGANAGYSSIQETDEDETLGRLAYQRIIVGSWLMTKEACASLASTITCNEFEPSVRLVEKVGSLLISTLTTLKHQGAAFAAHRALQDIVSFCFATSLDEGFADLPLSWAKRLIHDISGVDNVRDSTLRRSTGYALAFLSIMRSEPPSSVTPRILCPDIMATLVKMSLPPTVELEAHLQQMDLATGTEEGVDFASPLPTSQFAAAFEESEVTDQWRTRVHSLNILRLIILDAPLASVSRPFVGETIMSSLIGYEDSRWAVQNSATMVFAAVMLRVVDADKNASANGNNAITASELFRSYPKLPQFLHDMLKQGVKNMQLETATSSTRFVQSSLYPVLLLLSRVQPVTASGGGTTEITDTFVPTVLQCLQHHHHKVRRVAARALANISSDEPCRPSFVDSLLKNCEGMLRLSENQPQWNTIHGSLLGIQHLLLRTSNPGLLLTRLNELRASLSCFVDPNRDIFWCPPSCTAVALEILVTSATSTDECGNDIKDELAQDCLRIVSELGYQNHQSLSLLVRIGEARLAAVAARGFVVCCVSEFWDPTVDFAKRQSLLHSLSFLLENDVIDVRLEATKAFKKRIYAEIDALLSRADVTQQAQIDVVLGIARTLQKALIVEMDLLKDDVGVSIHPPTVRRLSRCLLECCHALQRLGVDLQENPSRHDSDILSARNIWEVALRMSELDGNSIETVDHVDNSRRLNGNAAELMAFAIPALSSTEDNVNNGHALAELTLFVRFVIRLNDEQEYWRMRHSVAVAIEKSRVLGLDDTDSADVKEIRLCLTNELLAMLQDSDPDVRFVTGRVIMHACSSNNSAAGASSSQLVLEEGYRLIPTRFADGSMNPYLLQSLVTSCRGVVEDLDRFEREIAQSKNSCSWSELMNLETQRKIFEDEIANPFEEVLLANQLRSVALVKERALLNPESVQELFSLCSQVLLRLLEQENGNKKSERAPDIAHEVTRSCSIFPLVHSLIVGSIAVIYLGAKDLKGVRGAASRISQLVTERETETTIHPCVARALKALASACPSDDTRQALCDCCFLLPTVPSLESACC